MSRCAQCKALRGAEAQVLRLKRTIPEFVKLLQNAREDGGLTKVQCDVMDQLVAQVEAIVTGQDNTTPDPIQELLSKCEIADVQTIIDGWDCLREIAVEIGAITILDLETLDPEDRTEIAPKFGLQCQIRALVGAQGECASCGHHGPRAVVLEVEHG